MVGKFKKKPNKLKIKKLQINFTDKWFYTFVVVISLIAVGIGVYAAAGTTPNPGHPFSQLQLCDVEGEILKNIGGVWACGADEVGEGNGAETDPFWTGNLSNVAFINKANTFGAFNQSFNTDTLFIDSNLGNVGIGTTSPAAPLHTKGGGTTVTEGGCIGRTNDCDYYTSELPCEGQEGCGWESKSCAEFLTRSECLAHADCGWDDFCFNNYYICEGIPNDCSSFGESACPDQDECSWATATRWTSNTAIFEQGKVGIGVTDPYYVLELPNIADTRGWARAGYWATYSSIRWKENIIPIDNALDKVSQLQGVYFDWKPEHGGTPGIGLIAEDVGKIIPEVVDWEDGGTYARSLDYDHLIALLIEAIKEQQQEIGYLRQAIETLTT